MRKRTISVFCLLLILFPLTVQAEENIREPRHAISLDPILILFNMYKGSYELGLTDSLSAKASIMYTPNLFWVTNISYFDIIPEGRYYMGPLIKGLLKDVSIDEKLAVMLFPSALNGPFLGIAPVFSTATINGSSMVKGLDKGESAKAFGLGFNATVGYKYRLTNKQISIFAEPYVGLQLWSLMGGNNGWTYYDKDGKKMEKPEKFDDGSGRQLLTYGINVGISF